MEDWNFRDRGTARGRRSQDRRLIRNARWRADMSMERAQMRSRALSGPPPIPAGFSPAEVLARGRARAGQQTQVRQPTHVTPIDEGVNWPVVMPVNTFYRMPIHTRGFIDLCCFVYQAMRGEVEKYRLALTEQEFCLSMFYYLLVKMGRVARLIEAGKSYLPALESTINYNSASVPALIARYVDCVGDVTTSGGVHVVPYVDVHLNNFGWPNLNDHSDIVELANVIIPQALAGGAPLLNNYTNERPEYFSFPERLDISDNFPPEVAFVPSAVTHWIQASQRIKSINMTTLGPATDGTPAIFVTREGDSRTFVKGWSVEVMADTHMCLGALFGFHERHNGQNKEARSLVFGQHWQTGDLCWSNYIAQLMAHARKPP